jgi:DNA repair protein RadC
MDASKQEIIKLPIHEWDSGDQPREKCREKGTAALSDAELLAIFLRTGNARESAVELARRLLKENANSLNKVADLTIDDLLNFKGIGIAKAVTLKAAFELGQRRRVEIVRKTQKIDSPEVILELMQDKNAYKTHEEFWVIFTNQASKVLAIENFGVGGLSASIVDIRMIVKRALMLNATAIAICHNHPSGDLFPSQADCQLTQQIKDALHLMNIKLLDHIVIHKNQYYSFVEENLL